MCWAKNESNYTSLEGIWLQKITRVGDAGRLCEQKVAMQQTHFTALSRSGCKERGETKIL